MKMRFYHLVSVTSLAFYGLFFSSFVNGQSADISGTWILNVTTSQGSGKPRFVLKQENDSIITGSYSGQFGEAPVTGKIKGNAFEFGYTIREITVKYVGTISKKQMEGKSIYGTIGEGSFTGKRKKKG